LYGPQHVLHVLSDRGHLKTKPILFLKCPTIWGLNMRCYWELLREKTNPPKPPKGEEKKKPKPSFLEIKPCICIYAY